MAPVTIERVRSAAAVITALRAEDVDARQRAEIGDPLTAYFLIVAKKVFPSDPESASVSRVRLMFAAYFLRAEIEGRKKSAPDEVSARKAVDSVTSLAADALDARISAEAGDVVMSFFSAFAQKFLPESEPNGLAGNVQLMVLAYLIHGTV